MSFSPTGSDVEQRHRTPLPPVHRLSPHQATSDNQESLLHASGDEQLITTNLFLRLLHKPTVAGSKIAQVTILQRSERAQIVSHIAIGRKNHRSRALKDMISREQQFLFGQQTADVVGHMTGRGDQFETKSPQSRTSCPATTDLAGNFGPVRPRSVRRGQPVRRQSPQPAPSLLVSGLGGYE